MKTVLLTGSPERAKNVIKRSIQVTLALCLAAFGPSIQAAEGAAERFDQARASCQNVSGSMTETIIDAPNDPYGRALGNVTGVLNGVSTALITSADGSTSFDVFVTNRGDMLQGTGAIVLTPIPSNPDEFTLNVALKITGGSGKYKGATGKLTYLGLAHFTSATTGTFDVIYRGSVCGRNVNADGN